MLVPDVLPQNVTSPQAVNYMPSARQLHALDNVHTTDIIKQFLLRQFVKKEIRENEAQQILTDVTIVDMQNNRTIVGHNEGTPHFAASINKLPVAMLMLEEFEAGNISMDSTLTWVATDRRAGNGMFDQSDSPLQASVRDVLHDMLNRSGNTAVRILVNEVLGGPYAVNDRLAAVAELEKTRLIPVDATRFYLGDTTSKEALFILRTILADDSNPAKDMKEYLRTNIFVNDGVRSQLAGNDFVVLVNKTGLLYDPEGNNQHDVGIIYNTKTGKSYGYSFLTTAPSESTTATPRADESLRNMGRYTLRYSGDKPVQTADQSPQLRQAAERIPDTRMVY